MNRLILPYPPSMNRLWRQSNGRTYKDPKAKQYQVVAKATALAVGFSKPISGPIRLMVELHPPSKKSIDLDNSMKAAIDALNGIAWLDDSQIVEIYAARREPVKDGALIVMWETA